MESPQMYDAVQTLSQLDLKKSSTVAAALTMANNNNNNNATATNNNNNNNSSTVNNNASNPSIHHNPLVVKQQQTAHHMQQAAAANNNNNTNNNNNSILQKHMLQQYTQNELDELTAQEITLDLQHLIDDQFREQEALGIFGDMVANPANPNGSIQANGVVSAAAKVLQLQQQHQHQQNLRSQQNQGYPRGALAYMPQAVHSGATYTNNSSDDNSSVSEASTIKEEPIDPQEYRRQLQAASSAPFLGGAANNGNANAGIYPIAANSYAPNANGNTFTTLTPAGVLHHQALPHLTGAHLASLKHHNKPMMAARKQSNKVVDKGTDEYRRRRERNNIAVRKSREKAKVRSREVEEKVKTLLKEKEALLRRLEEMTNEIQIHKQIYMQLMNHSNPEITRICRSFLNMSDHGI